MMRNDCELATIALLAYAKDLRAQADRADAVLGGDAAPVFVRQMRDEAVRCDVLASLAIRADVERGGGHTGGQTDGAVSAGEHHVAGGVDRTAPGGTERVSGVR